jgi:peptidoglycan/LPS O-acetylase OafA/YrhL
VGQTPSHPQVAWIDDLRALMIVLVVNMHACVPYSHVGGWYRMEDPEPAMPVETVIIFWQGQTEMRSKDVRASRSSLAR